MEELKCSIHIRFYGVYVHVYKLHFVYHPMYSIKAKKNFLSDQTQYLVRRIYFERYYFGFIIQIV